MLVRVLNAVDAEAYQELRLRALEECPAAFAASYSDEEQRSLPEIQRRVTPSKDGSRCVFGVFVDGRLSGMLAFIRPEREKIRHNVELAGMYVAPERRRSGLGGVLIDAAISHARTLDGVRQLRLTVNATNLAARSLYQEKGFKCFGMEPEAIHVGGLYYDEEMYIFRVVEAG